MTTVRTNDTGINLSEADLPKTGMFGEEEGDDNVEAPAAPEPQPEIEMPSPEAIKQRVIAAEDQVARRQLIMTIQRYYKSQRFATFLEASELIMELKQLTLAEMQSLLGEIRFAIQNKNTGDSIQRGVPQLIVAIEPIVSNYYDIKGLGNALVKSETFKDLLEEVALESQTFSNTPAHTRLFYDVIKTAFFVHEANDYIETQKRGVAEKEVRISSSTADLMK